ncbi:MAG: DUF6228 family protein [bacterium]
MDERIIIEGIGANTRVELSESLTGTRTQGIESFMMTLTTEGMQITRRVHLCSVYEVQGLADFFSGLAQGGKFAASGKTWETIEEDFKLSCKCDRQGRFLLTFDIRTVSFPSGYPSWTLRFTIELEPGQMASLGSGVRDFCRL